MVSQEVTTETEWLNAILRKRTTYPLGGSQAVIRLIAENLQRLGARLRLAARVQSILVEHDAAVGLRLESGETLRADRVLSAAHGHATLQRLLGGRDTEPRLEAAYSNWSLSVAPAGLARHRTDLSHLPGFGSRALYAPLSPIWRGLSKFFRGDGSAPLAVG